MEPTKYQPGRDRFLFDYNDADRESVRGKGFEINLATWSWSMLSVIF